MDARHRIIECHGIRDAVDLEQHIHCLETQAYSSILKAFVAQSDLLTWGKEELMTELRKELNITDGEHAEILMKTNSDESIKWIRGQRKLGSQVQTYIKANTSSCPSASMRSSIIRLKAPPSAAFYPQKKVSRSKASQISIPVPSSMPPKFNGDHLDAKFAHPKFNGDLLAAEFAYENAEKSIEMLNHNVQLPPVGKGKVPKGKYQLKKYFPASEPLKLQNSSDLIRIRATDSVIHDVEKMLSSREKPGPVDIERAKCTLMEQERALLEALGKVEDVLERSNENTSQMTNGLMCGFPDDASNQMQYCTMSKNTLGGQEVKIQPNFSGQRGRFKDSF
ncbi:uncharacterized protein LOC130722438 [Lotus japonicus]|uniref:uncharacterized protein LOC130722438 n=1 Tax=Lotus japonicus TaxID=34305 RepID=UPI002589DE52|nr:uncharacterized protein LOC130722438 [Lotus japonicus]